MPVSYWVLATVTSATSLPFSFLSVVPLFPFPDTDGPVAYPLIAYNSRPLRQFFPFSIFLSLVSRCPCVRFCRLCYGSLFLLMGAFTVHTFFAGFPLVAFLLPMLLVLTRRFFCSFALLSSLCSLLLPRPSLSTSLMRKSGC